ncbi:MAG: hypothetical protein WAT71_08330 [Ignavibacteria bacterium]
MKTKMISKKKITKTEKKQKGFGVKNYCEACLRIRKGNVDSRGMSENNSIPHTCRKSLLELNEFIFHMNIINGLRRDNMENEFLIGFLE